MRKLYEMNAYQFLKFINHPDAAKFQGREDRVFVDVDEYDRTIQYNYEEHPDFESGGAWLSDNFDQVKKFVEQNGTEIE